MRVQGFAFVVLALGGTILGATPVTAQLGIAARASTLGAGAEVSYRINQAVGVRLSGNLLEFSRDATIDNIDYHITPHLENGTAIVDLYPVGGGFHLSGGFLLNRNEGRMVARLNQDVTIGNRTYSPQEVGSLTGRVSFQRSAPYVGLGFGGRGKVAFLLDLGVGITGTPKVDLAGQTSLTGAEKAEFDANVARELGEVRAEVSQHAYLKFHPVVSLGIRLGF